jgi:hypothetical protein
MNTPDAKILIEKGCPYHYTDAGRELEEKADAALLPIFAEFLDRGYSPYDITSILYESVAEISREIVSTHRHEGKEAANQMLQDKMKA